jgi:hypothetical protein
MAADVAEHLPRRDAGDEAPRPQRAQRTAGPIQCTHPPQEPGPRPIRGSRRRCLPIHPLLARGGDDTPAERAVRREAPPRAHQMDVWQGDQCRQLLQEFQRRECAARGPVRPRVGAGVEASAVGVCLAALQGHGPAGGRAEQALPLLPPMRRKLRRRVERNAVHTGTARTAEPWRLTLVAPARAAAPALVAGPLPTGDALLDRGRQGAGERRLVVPQWLIPRGHGGLHARRQGAQVAQRAEHAPTALLDPGGEVGVGRWLAREQAGSAPLVRAIELDPLQAEQVRVHLAQKLRSLPHPLQCRQCELRALEDETLLQFAPSHPVIQTLALHNEVGHQAQGNVMLLGVGL